MNIEIIAMQVLNIEKILIFLGGILTYAWWGYLFVLVFKALITKSDLDKKKRNVVLIKCISMLIVGYTGLIVLRMITASISSYSYFLWFGIHTFKLLLLLLYFAILLFYSGTPLIFCSKRVNYPWPLHFLNERANNTVEQ